MNIIHLRRACAAALTAVVVAAVIACSTVPMTGRSQLVLMSSSEMTQLSLDAYQKVIGESTLSTDPYRLQTLKRVGGRCADAAEVFMQRHDMSSADFAWEFNLIEDDDTVNAWCMPGGKIAVYTGILPYTVDDAGLAVVIGHEIAHALARHGNERMSQQLAAQMGAVSLSYAMRDSPGTTRNLFMNLYGAGATYGVLLPYSRQQESEADRIGLTITAMAGYDPREAVPFWERMKETSGGERPPEFLSTHPAPDRRIADLRDYMPEALEHYHTP